ncbi:MAG TPA: CHAP domain-containing protein [Candidatus Saccharimonadales bacterium]|nr:CHAP domain-containing protein [Candidatus Saccharimonadales bacterium]
MEDLPSSDAEGVESSKNVLLSKLFIIATTLLIATSLVVVSVKASADNMPDPRIGARTVWKYAAAKTSQIIGDILTVPRAFGRSLQFGISMLDVPKFIKPAADSSLPTIAPLQVKLASKVTKTTAPLPTFAAGVAAAASNPTPNAAGLTNYYEWGNCTWWAAKLRAQNGHPVPGSWGNAATWSERAAADGYIVDHFPSPGAVVEISTRGYGHVAFVESVDKGGNWSISEMNVLGLDVVDHQTLPLSAAGQYEFIHDHL